MKFQKGNKLSKGRKRGAKSIVGEGFYEMCLRYKDDPEGLGGYEGFRDLLNGNKRLREKYLDNMARFAEKQIKQVVDNTGTVDHTVNVKVTFVDTKG